MEEDESTIQLLLSEILSRSTEYEQDRLTLKYRDSKIEEEFILLHHQNTIIFGRYTIGSVFFSNVIDSLFEVH